VSLREVGEGGNVASRLLKELGGGREPIAKSVPEPESAAAATSRAGVPPTFLGAFS
jgi:hypothetical protein